MSSISVPNTKQSGQVLFDFIQSQKELWADVVWVGGVNGPGGFATLRVAAGVLNSWKYAHNCPVRQVRADNWLQSWIGGNEYERFVLNSFGDSVFLGDVSDMKKVKLVDVPNDKKIWIGSLPESKKELLNNKSDQGEVSIESLYDILKETFEQDLFVPEYMHDAV